MNEEHIISRSMIRYYGVIESLQEKESFIVTPREMLYILEDNE